MTMKKRFLGLALAAMVAVPATTAYANTITGVDTRPLSHTVPVTGSVANKQGVAPEGTLTVEVPTAMAFAVDQDGNFDAPTYEVANRSSKGITVAVKEFRETIVDGGITLEDISSFAPGSKDRSHIALVLNGNLESGSTSVDLSQVDKTNGDNILDIRAGQTGILSLTGVVGSKAADDTSNGVDAKGVRENFNLVFEIKKNENLN